MFPLRNKKYKNLSAPGKMSGKTGIIGRSAIQRPATISSSRDDYHDSGSDIIDTIIAAEIISEIIEDSSSYDSPSNDYYDGGDSGGGGADDSW